MSPAVRRIARRPSPRCLIALLAVCVSGAGARAVEDTALHTPYDAIRALRRLEEQVAHGSTAAQAAQGPLLASIAQTFVAAEPAAWRDPRNARAAIVYLFSGGQPAVVRIILARSTVPRELDRLLKGALAYAEGQDQIARDLLEPIDPRSVSPVVGGQLALVEATLVAPQDPKKAARFLDLARLLVPGSLVEEAALRRQISLETGPESIGKFIFLAREYLHRYRGSIYAQNFKQHFAYEALRLGASGDVATIARLEPVIAELVPAEQRTLYLAIARRALVQGQTAAARFAAERAAAIAKGSAPDTARAKLYIDAAAIVSTDVAKGVAALEAADRSSLSSDDLALADAALAVAHSVAAPVAESSAGTATAADPELAATLAAAHKALATGDTLLGANP